MSHQPKWKMIANLGDAAPFDYGGFFIFTDEPGVYPAEAVLLEVNDENVEIEETTYTAHRFILERCSYVDGILSDNKFHRDHPAWFAHPEEGKKERPQDTTYLSNVASHCGIEEAELIRLFCSEDPCERAVAYRAVGEYHGMANLDEDPDTLTYQQAIAKYGKDFKALEEREKARRNA